MSDEKKREIMEQLIIVAKQQTKTTNAIADELHKQIENTCRLVALLELLKKDVKEDE